MIYPYSKFYSFITQILFSSLNMNCFKAICLLMELKNLIKIPKIHIPGKYHHRASM